MSIIPRWMRLGKNGMHPRRHRQTKSNIMIIVFKRVSVRVLVFEGESVVDLKVKQSMRSET